MRKHKVEIWRDTECKKPSALDSAMTIAAHNVERKRLKTMQDDANTARKFVIMDADVHWRNVLKLMNIVKDAAHTHT